MEKENRLTFIKETRKDKYNCRLALYLCKCGNIKEMRMYRVNGGVLSCGCKKGNHSHGMSGTTEQKTYHEIKQRCYNKKSPNYSNYGGRGILMSNEWLSSIDVFLEDMGKKPVHTYSIERLDNDLGYSKENCVWSNKDTQANNRRNNLNIPFNNKNYTPKEFSLLCKIKLATLHTRLHRGWSAEKIFNTPARKLKSV